MIKLAPNLALPTSATTETFAILARKDGGKTYCGLKSFEEMYAVGAQCVAIDPVGKWWSLRLAADGKSPGIDVTIFGGPHADVELEPTAGALIAQFIVERRVSAVIDVSLFEDRDMKRFVTDFARELYKLKQRQQSVLHLFLEEASLFCPQEKEDGNDPPMLNALKKIVRKGRNYGIGSTMIDQRAQDVNKKVLNQASILIVLGTSGTTDRTAIEKWVRDKHIDASGLDELASLQQGDAFAWLPREKTFKRIHIGKRWTFDASKTPTLGKRIRRERKLKKKDVAALKEAIKAMVERIKAEDPKALRQEVARLKTELQKKVQAASVAAPAPRGKEKVYVDRRVVVEVPVIKEEDVKRFERACAKMQKALDKHMAELEPHRQRIDKATKAILSKMGETVAQGRRMVSAVAVPVVNKPAAPPPVNATPAKKAKSSKVAPPPTDGEAPTKMQQGLLNGLAWFEAVGVQQPRRAALAGIIRKSQSGYFNDNLSSMRTAGWITYPAGKCIALTDVGRALAQAPDSPPTLSAFHEGVYDSLDKIKALMLREMVGVYPSPLSRADLAERIGKSESGYFNDSLSSLHTMELIDYPMSGHVKAAAVLFPEGLE